MCLLWFNRLERFSYGLAKWFRSVFVIFVFVNQWMKSSKYSNFVFPPKKTLIWRRHCSIGQSCCSMTSKRSIDWFLESSRAWSLFTRAFAQLTKSHARLYPFDKPILCCFCFVRAFSFQGHENRSIFGLNIIGEFCQWWMIMSLKQGKIKFERE